MNSPWLMKVYIITTSCIHSRWPFTLDTHMYNENCWLLAKQNCIRYINFIMTMPRRGSDGYIHPQHHETQKRHHCRRGGGGVCVFNELCKECFLLLKMSLSLAIPTSHSAANEAIKSDDISFVTISHSFRMRCHLHRHFHASTTGSIECRSGCTVCVGTNTQRMLVLFQV